MARPLPEVVRVRSFVLRAPLGDERFYSSQSSFPERNSFLVSIEAQDPDGTTVTGWGEGGQYGPAEPVAAIVDDVLAPFLLGREVQPTRLWEEMYNATRDFGQRGAYIDAISALDVALWDCLGKAVGLPLSDLIGGAHRRTVATYGTGCYYRGEAPLDVESAVRAAAEEAVAIVGSGFRYLKTKVGLMTVEDDARRIAAIRAAVGPAVRLMVDANHAYTVPAAQRMARLLEPLDITFFEEPVVPEDIAGHALLRQKSGVPIASGEGWFTRHQFLQAFQAGAVDFAQPDINACGGVSEFLKIATLASAFHINVIPHCWGSGVALATTLHCVAALPNSPHTANPIPLQNEPVVEFDRNPNQLRDALLGDSWRFELDESGRLSVPTGPGLGVEVDMDVLRAHLTREGCTPAAGGLVRRVLAPIFVEVAVKERREPIDRGATDTVN